MTHDDDKILKELDKKTKTVNNFAENLEKSKDIEDQENLINTIIGEFHHFMVERTKEHVSQKRSYVMELPNDTCDFIRKILEDGRFLTSSYRLGAIGKVLSYFKNVSIMIFSDMIKQDRKSKQ